MEKNGGKNPGKRGGPAGRKSGAQRKTRLLARESYRELTKIVKYQRDNKKPERNKDG